MYRSFATLFDENGKQVLYSLRATGSDWKLKSYGYHGTALAVCETCEPEDTFGGLVHIGMLPQPYEKIIKEGVPCLAAYEETCTEPEQDVEKTMPAITTAKLRIESDVEHLYYPIHMIPIENRIPVYQTDELRSGKFKGYGVVYRILNPTELQLPRSITGMIAFGLRDHCASFTGTIAVPIEKAQALLNSFADAMVVERSEPPN